MRDAPAMLTFGAAPVPWNAAWSAEHRYEVRPCRWVGGALALWSPHLPGEGKPQFARPHMVRQRRSIAEMRCTVCGEKTPPDDRWWFKLGDMREGYFMTTEAPVHHACGEFALTVCPHLRGREQDFEPLPPGYRVLRALIGGAATDNDFGVEIRGRRVFGHLKLAWPEQRVRRAL
ncbi:hypothetical protein BH10PSE14_BH10PSE14_06200 [soil metagenome]